MKQKLVLSLLSISLMAVSALATPGENLTINAGTSQHITISGNLDVILVSNAGADQEMLVNSFVVEKLNLKFSGNSLSIAPATTAASQKITVYVYVSQLKSLLVENNASVRTVGVLNAPKLDLMIGGEARVHLRTNGVVKPRPIYDGEIKVKFISESGIARSANNHSAHESLQFGSKR